MQSIIRESQMVSIDLSCQNVYEQNRSVLSCLILEFAPLFNCDRLYPPSRGHFMWTRYRWTASSTSPEDSSSNGKGTNTPVERDDRNWEVGNECSLTQLLFLSRSLSFLVLFSSSFLQIFHVSISHLFPVFSDVRSLFCLC